MRLTRRHNRGLGAELSAFWGTRDPLARMHGDPDHSQEEWRAIMVGHSGQDRLLVVSFVYRSDRIRIVSAREATRGERREYEESA